MTTRSLNVDFDVKLIDLVRANPTLYAKDLRTCPYSSMKKKIELWNSIAASMETDTSYCISRWKALRDRYRRELVKSKQKDWNGKSVKEVPWILFENLNFLQRHISYNSGKYEKQKKPNKNQAASWTGMDAESLIEEVHDDDPLQEAMDEQSTFDRERGDAIIAAAATSSTATTVPMIGSLKRIEVLLDGLDETNRLKAERRIVAYLCKCQLKVLNNDDVDDVVI